MGYKIVALDTHRFLGWSRPKGYQFAASDLYCPISLSELKSSFWRFPIAFVKNNEGFDLVVLLGCQKNQNLFVAKDGTWIGEAVPMMYKNHPFKLLQVTGKEQGVTKEKLTLCIDEANEERDAEDNESFFTTEGKLTELVSQIANQLLNQKNSLAMTQEACDKLYELDLIVPWEASVEMATNEIKLGGLYCVDHDRLTKLSGKILKQLMTMDALSLIYMHLQSMQNISRFKFLVEAHNKAMGINTGALDDLNFGEPEGSGNINLGNLDHL